MEPKKHTIRHLLHRQDNPNLYRVRKTCLYLIHVSQLIKDHTGGGNNYTDSHYECTKLKKRITKRSCANCKLHIPCNNGTT